MFRQFKVSAQANRLFIRGDVSQDVRLEAAGFFKSLLSLPSPRSVDFLRLAAGIYALDRICRRAKRPGNDSGARQLEVVFGVRDLEFWQQESVFESLTEVLGFLTGDDWLLGFEEAQEGGPFFQERLALPDFPAQQVALYSGGLDSAGGLASRLIAGHNGLLLVTVGHRSGLHQSVHKQLVALAELMQNATGRKPYYLHSTLTVSLQGGKSKRISVQEQSQRTRSFLFCVAAMLAARNYEIDIVEMFENGIGAINLPLMSGMLDNGLATRGAHPEFLRKMSALAELIFEKRIVLSLPFDNMTKGEMLQPLKGLGGLEEWAHTTASCIHTSMRVKAKRHCGSCPACIERRQAFRVAGIYDDASRYVTDIFEDPVDNKMKAGYFKLYQLDALEWVNGKAGPRARMERHLRVSGIQEVAFQRYSNLLHKHAKEVFTTFGSPFTKP